MERKIGEIFEHKGEWYQCIGNPYNECTDCDFCFEIGRACVRQIVGQCSMSNRSDGLSVVFKKLEKVGEPYITGNKLIQRYKIYPTTYCINVYCWYYYNLDVKSWTIDIEIKQTKEDMEEKKLNLKPFDIQKARAGKPVCTRDGRKARIICFDTKGDPCPIIALVEENNIESAYHYDKNGQNAYNKSKLDLMMLPEKKEGWVNLYNADTTFYYVEGMVYNTKDEAIRKAKEEITTEQREKSEYIDTVKINWSE